MANAPSAAVQRLVDVVAQLRNPATGCPWDLEQTHASLVPYVLEEAHEVADAIRQGDDQHLKEELGDLLLQVVLHAQIAGEEQRFDLNAIADGISNKLIRRHPHVFGDAEAKTSDDVRRSWDAIKLEEQAEALAGSTSPLSDRLKTKVRGLPALAGAMTISKKAAKAGFEWDHMAGVWEKVHEELDELKGAVASGNKDPAQEELGVVPIATGNRFFEFIKLFVDLVPDAVHVIPFEAGLGCFLGDGHRSSEGRQPAHLASELVAEGAG